MKLSTIDTGFFKLDGGAMFGVVPKKLWNKLNPSDGSNMCTWAMRCLLIETDDRKILVDTGIGTKQDEKFRSHFEPFGEANLLSSLAKMNVAKEEITDVFLTHLHFDHVGGALVRNNDKIVPQFPNAKYWTNKKHLDWALAPNAREKASFLKENIVPLIEHDVLHFIDKEGESWVEGIDIKYFFGHTEAMMVPIITLDNGKKFAFTADLMPSSYHIRSPYVMSYDIRPLVTIQEKNDFLNYAYKNKICLIFEHDPVHECGYLAKDKKENFYFSELITLKEALY